jgi:hypothetical protein
MNTKSGRVQNNKTVLIRRTMKHTFSSTVSPADLSIAILHREIVNE